MRARIKNRVLTIFGFMSLLLALIGAFLPIMPTVPFVILAAFFFSKGSPRMHQWLLNHRFMGPPLRDWEKNQVIRPRAKVIALTMMTAGIVYPIFFLKGLWGVKAVVVMIWASIAAYVLTRKSRADS